MLDIFRVSFRVGITLDFIVKVRLRIRIIDSMKLVSFYRFGSEFLSLNLIKQ